MRNKKRKSAAKVDEDAESNYRKFEGGSAAVGYANPPQGPPQGYGQPPPGYGQPPPAYGQQQPYGQPPPAYGPSPEPLLKAAEEDGSGSEEEEGSSGNGPGGLGLCLAACLFFVIAGVIVGIVIYCSTERVRAELNKLPGYISDDLQRVVTTPRSDMTAKLEKYKVFYGNEGSLEWGWCEWDAYWNERAKADISANAEAEIMEATWELHNMALEAVDTIVKDDVLLTMFYVNRELWPAIRESWDKGQVDFQGRFDFAWDGTNPPKLLEYNADTPSLQLESSVLSQEWFVDKYRGKGVHQANYFMEAMSQALAAIVSFCSAGGQQINLEMQGMTPLYDIGLTVIPEDEENTAVMQWFLQNIQMLTQKVFMFPINNLDFRYGNDGVQTSNYWYSGASYQAFDRTPYNCLFNNYPKEWLITETEPYPMKRYDFEALNSVEPFWKILLGNKALLPLLWAMYPNHPNLLPATYDDPRVELGMDEFNRLNASQWVSKPIFGREGLGVFFSNNYTKLYGQERGFDMFVETTENNFGRDTTGMKLGESIYQMEADLPTAQGRVIQTSSWVVGGMPASIIFREGRAGQHFEDTNPFLLHTVRSETANPFNYRLSDNQRAIRDKIYGERSTSSQIYNKFGGAVSFSTVPQLREQQNGTWVQWPAYQRLQDQVARETAAERPCDDSCQNYIRSRSMGLQQDMQEPAQAATFVTYYNYNYQRPATQFGSISRLDYGGGGYWFSVDAHGNVRRHSYSTAGFARS